LADLGAHALHANVVDRSDGFPNLGLGRADVHFEAVAVAVARFPGALFGHHRTLNDLCRVHYSSPFEAFAPDARAVICSIQPCRAAFSASRYRWLSRSNTFRRSIRVRL